MVVKDRLFFEHPEIKGMYVNCDGIVFYGRGKISKGTNTPQGYKIFHYWENGKSKAKYIHQLVAETFLEKPDDDNIEINHKNGDKADNRLINLEYTTHSSNCNNEHTRRNGANKKGKKKPVILFNPTTRQTLYFDSVRQASQAIGVGISSLTNAILYDGYHQAKGWKVIVVDNII